MVPISHIGLKWKLTKRKIKNHKKLCKNWKKTCTLFERKKWIDRYQFRWIMNRYVKPSNEIVREAKEWTLNTRRPETPRHTPGSDRWRSYHDAGDHLRIDKCKFWTDLWFLELLLLLWFGQWQIILAESRPVTKQSVRLDPIAAPSPSKPPRPKGSANDRFVRLVEQFATSSVNDRWNYCEKIAKCFDKLDGEITAEQREKLLAGCAEILDRENVPSSQVRSRLFHLRILNNFQSREWVSVK